MVRPTPSRAVGAAPSVRPRNERGFRHSWNVFWRFFLFLRPYKSFVVLNVLLLIVGIPWGQIGVYLGKFLIDDVLLATDTPTADRLILLRNVMLAQAVLFLLGRLTAITKHVVNMYLDIKVTLDVTEAFYRHLNRLSMRFLRSRPIGENMYRTAEDTENKNIYSGLTGLITDDWMVIVESVYRALITAALIFTIDPLISLLILFYFGPWSVGTHLFNTWYKQLRFDQKQVDQERFAVMRDIVAGLKSIKAFGRGRWAFHRYFGIMNFAQRWHYKWHWAQWLGMSGPMRILDILFTRGIAVFCGVQVMRGTMTIGEITVVTFLVFEFLKPFKDVMNLVQTVRMKLIPAERLLQTLDEKPDIEDRPGAVEVKTLSGAFEFRGIRFGHSGMKPLFEGLDLRVEAGERVALVGPSGAGKSTLLNLLLRLFDPEAGAVLADGKDLRDLRLKSYLKRSGVVLQDTFLFSGSIRENIQYGNLLASEGEVREAAEKADLGSLLAAHPAGLDAFLGEGTRLSGGQKQRIGIARALLRKPDFFLFDEPTAHLDVHSEAHVMETVKKVTEGRTTFIVSHRLAPVLFVDKIAVVAGGKIEAFGHHHQLLAVSPTYARLWSEQGAGALEASS